MSLVIEEQPQEFIRFGNSGDGFVFGRKSSKTQKKFPSVKILGHSGFAEVQAELVKNKTDTTPHPHKLTGKNVKDGKYVIKLGPSNMRAVFKDMQIMRTKKIDYENEFCKGENSNKVGLETKSINFFKVHFMFTADLYDMNKRFLKTLTVVSDAVADNGDPLKMVYKSLSSGCVLGGDELVLICSKVKKDDVEVLFIQLNQKGETTWCDKAKFHPNDVYYQHTIVCKTPPYKNRTTRTPVTVNVQLYRPSDQSYSKLSEFTFTPNQGFNQLKEYTVGGKRRIIEPCPSFDRFCSVQKPSSLSKSSADHPLMFTDYNSAMETFDKQREAKNVDNTCSHLEDRTFQPSPDPGFKSDTKTQANQVVDEPELKLIPDGEQLQDLDCSQDSSSKTIGKPVSDDSPASQYNGIQAFMMSPETPICNKEIDFEKTEFHFNNHTDIDGLLRDLQKPSTSALIDDLLNFAWEDIEIDGPITKKLSQLTIDNKTNDNFDASSEQENKLSNMKNSASKKMADNTQGTPTNHTDEKIDLIFRFLSKQTHEKLRKMLYQVVEENNALKLYYLLLAITTLPNADEIVNHVNEQGHTVLHVASLLDNCETAALLLKSGADPFVRDQNGNHAAHVACRHGNNLLLKLMIDSKNFFIDRADLKNNKGLSCFHLALKASSGKEQCLTLLHQHRFDPNGTENKRGRTPLHTAVAGNDVKAVRCLVSVCRADINARSYDDFTPLHLAAARDLPDVASLLLELGASRDALVLDSDNVEARPIDFAQSDLMKNILESVKLPFCTCNTRQTDDRENLSRHLHEIGKVLNPALSTESRWKDLSRALNLSFFDCYIRNSDNPVFILLRTYDTISRGTIQGLIDGLMKINREDMALILKTKLPLT